jgi:cytochrome P450 family 142 subfamily A polypeptide 1
MDIDLIDGRRYAANPHAQWAWLRENSPLHWDEPNNVWGVTRYDDVRAISADPVTFSNAGGIRPGLPAVPMMIDMDDPEHIRRRKLVNKGFTPRRVRDLEPAIRAACDEILDGVCEKGEADLVNDIAALLPMRMIGDALGMARDDHPRLLTWSDELLRSLSGGLETMVNAAEVFAAYEGYANEVIAERRGCPAHQATPDLMSILVHSTVDGDRLDDDEIIMESLLILIGGDETTRHVISGGELELIKHPDQRRRLAGDPALMPTAVEEMLRWVSPIKNMVRTATRDVEIRGQQVKEGEELMLLYPSANRDEEVFVDAFTFDIARDPNEHLAFGFGTHFCMGASLARLEISVMVERLLDRLPDLALAADEADLPIRPANFVSGHESIPVTFTPSAPTGIRQPLPATH